MNVLLSSVGRRSYLAKYFKESLNGTGLVVGTNCIPDAAGLLSCDVREVVPFCYEPDFVDVILRLCKKYDIRLLFSFHDLEAPFLMKRKEDFLSLGTFPVIADLPFLNIC